MFPGLNHTFRYLSLYKYQLWFNSAIIFPLQDLNNQLKKLSDETAEKESALKQEYQELLEQTKRKLQTHEVTIQRLTSTLADKEQQLQVTC